MKAHLIDTHLLVLRSRASAKVKVKYQGHVSQKMGVSGGISVSQGLLPVCPIPFCPFPFCPNFSCLPHSFFVLSNFFPIPPNNCPALLPFRPISFWPIFHFAQKPSRPTFPFFPKTILPFKFPTRPHFAQIPLF